jgi:hypothetical protein
MNDSHITSPRVETFYDLKYGEQCAIADWGGEWVGKLLERGWSNDAIWS